MKKKHLKKIIPPELRHKIIDYLRLKEEIYWWSKINIIIQCNNGISKNKKLSRWYNESTI